MIVLETDLSAADLVTPANQRAKLSDIAVPPNRARSFDQDEAVALAATITEIGLQHPIRLRSIGNRFSLVSGRKRLEAVRLLGWDTIPYTLSSATSDEEARIEEVLENLARPKLVKLDRYRHLFELKMAFEWLHPDVKRGGDRKTDKIKVHAVDFDPDELEIFGFTKTSAEKIGMSRSAIFEAVQIWKNLSDLSHQRCEGTWLADHKAGLKQLSEQCDSDQAKVLDLLFNDPPLATNVKDAVAILVQGIVKSETEKKLDTVKASLRNLPDTVAASVIDDRLSDMRKSIDVLSKFFGRLEDDELDKVVEKNEERIIASLQRRGVI